MRTCVTRYAFTGSIAFYFIEAGDGTLSALECNPRMTSASISWRAAPKIATALLGNGNLSQPHGRPFGP